LVVVEVLTQLMLLVVLAGPPLLGLMYLPQGAREEIPIPGIPHLEEAEVEVISTHLVVLAELTAPLHVAVVVLQGFLVLEELDLVIPLRAMMGTLAEALDPVAALRVVTV
jgi:hypothetical protein